MKNLQDEISRMKIKNDLDGFKEWREGTVERTSLNDPPPPPLRHSSPWGCSHLKKKKTNGLLGVLFRA